MPCYHPLAAWRAKNGTVALGKELPDSASLQLPCGGCLGCRTAAAKAWALRAMLELHQHEKTAFTTLTYDETNKPPTLRKRDLQLFLKRFRKEMGAARPIRFFASGEYGETTNRPHYHAVLYGASEADADIIHHTWGLGHTDTDPITPARIAYTAGYVAKKIGWRHQAAPEQIDYNTGELYHWQPPFLQMSRRPGIGADARQYTNSWRTYAVNNGTKQKVPRYLHDAWKSQATPEQLEQLAYELAQKRITLTSHNTTERLEAAELIAKKAQEIQADRRKL